MFADRNAVVAFQPIPHDIPSLQPKEHRHLLPHLSPLAIDALHYTLKTRVTYPVPQIPVHLQHPAGDRAQVVRRERVGDEDTGEREGRVVRLVRKETVLGGLNVDAHDDVDGFAELFTPLEQPAEGGVVSGGRGEGVEDLREGVLRCARVIQAREELVDAGCDGSSEEGEVHVPPSSPEEILVVAVDDLEVVEVCRVVLRDVGDDFFADAVEVEFGAETKEGEDGVEGLVVLAVDVVETDILREYEIS